MVFEMLGDNLLTLIKYYNYRGVPMPIVKRLTKDILEALAFLHAECSIIHTDLKPENVLLSKRIPQLPRLSQSLFHHKNDQSTQRQQQSKPLAETDLSKDEKKKLKKKQKKKRQRMKKQGDADSNEPDAVQIPCEPAADIDALSEQLDQLELQEQDSQSGFSSNFWQGDENEALSTCTIVSAASLQNANSSRKADQDEPDWIHLPPEFAARVMLVLPDGKVAGSRKREQEFTIAVTSALGKEEEVQTSLVLRYVVTLCGALPCGCLRGVNANCRFVDRLDAQRTEALANALSRVAINKDHAMGSVMPKLKFWRLEFDARYTTQVFGKSLRLLSMRSVVGR